MVACVFEKNGEMMTAEGQLIILATGRKANTADLDLEAFYLFNVSFV